MKQYEPYVKMLAERGIDIDPHEITTIEDYGDSLLILMDGSIYVKNIRKCSESETK